MRHRLRPTVRMCAMVAPLLAFAGCGHSPATTLLTLDALAPPPAGVRSDYHGLPLAIPAVHLPAELDRPEYVHEVAAGQVKVDDFSRWVAPLGTLARDTLVRDLTARLPAGAVLPPGAAGGPGTRTIDVTILSFVTGPTTSTLQAAYREVPHGRVQQVAFTTSASATGGALPNAQALSLLIGQLADQIAQGLPPR